MNKGFALIREFDISDHAQVLELWGEAGLEHRPTGRDSRESIADQLRKGSMIFLVAEMEHRIVGTLLCTYDGRKGWINRIAVHPDLRRQGIATAMLRRVEHSLDQKGIGVFCCLIHDWNKDSIEFFESSQYSLSPDVKYYSKRRREGI